MSGNLQVGLCKVENPESCGILLVQNVVKALKVVERHELSLKVMGYPEL